MGPGVPPHVVAVVTFRGTVLLDAPSQITVPDT